MTTGVRLIAAFLLIATLLYPQGKKSKKPKGPEAEIESIAVRREGDVVLLDGAVKNLGMRAIHGMTLHFEFYAPNRESLTVQSGPVEAAIVEPGETAEFRLQVKYPTRAVELKIEARDKDQRELTLEKAGPYRID
jgi:hypothetical protein